MTFIPIRHALRLRSDWIVAAIVLVAVAAGFIPRFEHSGAPMDEGMVLVYPEMVSHGQVPYRDFETFYGPANPWLLALVSEGFGWNIFVERGVGLFYRLLILIAIFGIARRWNTTAAAACVVISGCLLYSTNLVAYAWMGGVACAVVSIWLISGVSSRWRCLAAGLFAGAAILFRLDLAPAVILSSLPLLIWSNREQKVAFLAGITVGAILPLAVLSAVAGPQQLFNNLLLFPVLRSSPGRHLPLTRAAAPVIRLFILHLCAIVVNLAAGGFVLKDAPFDRRNQALLALALFATGLTHQAWQRLDISHCLFAAFLTIGLLPLSVFVLWSRRGIASATVVPSVVTAGVVLLVVVLARPLAQSIASSFVAAFRSAPAEVAFVNRNDRSFAVGSPELAATITRLLARMDAISKPGERLFVGPGDLRRTNYCDTFIYHMMPKLNPATYFLEMNPFSANRPDSRLTADIKSADWLVLNQAWDECEVENRSCENGSDSPNRVVRDNFTLAGEFGTYRLFRHRGL